MLQLSQPEIICLQLGQATFLLVSFMDIILSNFEFWFDFNLVDSKYRPINILNYLKAQVLWVFVNLNVSIMQKSDWVNKRNFLYNRKLFLLVKLSKEISRIRISLVNIVKVNKIILRNVHSFWLFRVFNCFKLNSF